MSAYEVRYETLEFGDEVIHVRSLLDNQQFSDDDGEAEAIGISSATWPIFGILWGSGRVLARLMADYDVGDRRVLEVGCGLALASLVLSRRGVDVTATDRHPEASKFLQENTRFNNDPDIKFVRTGWHDPKHPDLGEFDLILASDTLYERSHVAALSNFINQHAKPTCEVLVIDPRRGETGRFTKCMTAFGFEHSISDADPLPNTDPKMKAQVHRFVRTAD